MVNTTSPWYPSKRFVKFFAVKKLTTLFCMLYMMGNKILGYFLPLLFLERTSTDGYLNSFQIQNSHHNITNTSQGSGFQSSGMTLCHWVSSPNVLRDHSAFIFRVQGVKNSNFSWTVWPQRRRHCDPSKHWNYSSNVTALHPTVL